MDEACRAAVAFSGGDAGPRGSINWPTENGRRHISAGRMRPRPFSELFNVAASRPAQMTTGSSVSSGGHGFPSWRHRVRSARLDAWRAAKFQFGIEDKGILPSHDRGARRRRRHSRRKTSSCPTRSSPPASIFGSARSLIACGRAFFRAARPVAGRIDELKLHEISLSDGAVSKRAASTSCR